MKYMELQIRIARDELEKALDVLSAAGFESLVIDDPADLKDIEEHPEWYKYDYINEELAGRTDEKPGITLYFSDDEEGRAEAARAEAVLKSLRAAISSLPNNDSSDFHNQNDKVQAYFTIKPSDNNKCGSAPPGGLEWRLRETGDDSEWLYKWQERFKPTRVGERIVVKPSWEDYEPAPGELVIEMDPGMAFGSGLHETTTLCIKALEKYTNSCRVLDVGTGTGILAIAAALLGADECLGIDIDEDAVRIARENVERNGLSDKIKIEKGDLLDADNNKTFTADEADRLPPATEETIPENDCHSERSKGFTDAPGIIVANLMADLVIRLAPAAAARLKKGGIFISSGILDIKEDIVSEAVRSAGFEINEVLHDGEWCAIVAKRV